MLSTHDLAKTVSVINSATIPALKEYLFNLNLHVGEYKLSARGQDFCGWLVCDGRSLSKTTYARLYDVIGTKFGSNDANTFKLPDFRGRAIGIVGQGPGLINRLIGAIDGTETHTLTVPELPGHTHTGTTNSDGVHNHTATASTTGSHNHGGTTGTTGSHTHTTNATGGSLGLATADGTNTVINTDPSGGELNVWTTPQALTVNTAGDHAHTITSDGSHTHALTVNTAGSHTHTFTTNSTGEGDAFSVMQPTLFGSHVLIFAGYV